MHLDQLLDLTGKVALITGGSRGLGLEIAVALGEAGAAVAITGRRESWLMSASEQLAGKGVRHHALVSDGSQPDQAAAAVSAVIAEFGRLDVLVNNAGTSWGAPAETMPLAKWHEVIGTNATGCFLMSQAAGRHMIEAGRGSIINVTSYLGLIGTSPKVLDAVGYTASKGAMISLTRDLAVKWGRYGIRVNAIAPGFFDTKLSSGVLKTGRVTIEDAAPMRRIGRPGELKGVAQLLASDAASYITGQVIAIDGGTTVWA